MTADSLPDLQPQCYPVPFHSLQCFAHPGHRPGTSSGAGQAAATSIALPIYRELTDEQLRTVVNAIALALHG